ncbi:CsiV family protein [Halopseudomonas pachastrellae]|uniref:CsiV family protein n=1 Tax=Halopseudomonas pachastrellae TaxID=254161 RepID=UPI003D7DF820
MKQLSNALGLLLLSTLLAVAPLAQAEDYLVEVVFFGQPSAPLVQGTPPDLDWDANAIDLASTARPDVRSIDKTRYRLDEQARKLEQSGYQIYLHQAWTQPLDNDLVVALHRGQADNGIYPVQGLVRLSQDNLTELQVAFWRNRPTAELGLQAATSVISEQLHQTRALRVNEVHYLDHQSLGMLVTISR